MEYFYFFVLPLVYQESICLLSASPWQTFCTSPYKKKNCFCWWKHRETEIRDSPLLTCSLSHPPPPPPPSSCGRSIGRCRCWKRQDGGSGFLALTLAAALRRAWGATTPPEAAQPERERLSEVKGHPAAASPPSGLSLVSTPPQHTHVSSADRALALVHRCPAGGEEDRANCKET